MAEVILPGSLFQSTYPEFFPCPTWEYGQTITSHEQRAAFECGWTRQRKRWQEQNSTVNLSFSMPTDMFDNWSRWMVNNGYKWFAIPLDRFSGEQAVYEVRLISKIQFSYRAFDTVLVNVLGELGAPLNASTPADVTTPLGDAPLKEALIPFGPDDRDEYPECEPYACNAITDYLLGLDGVDAWEPTEATTEYTGGQYSFVNSSGERLNFSGKTPVGLNFSTGSIIPGACYGETWWRDTAHSSQAETEDSKGSVGMLLRNHNTAIVNEYLTMYVNILDPWGGSAPALSVAVEDSGGSLHVETGGFDGPENQHWVPWSTIGVDPDLEAIVISATASHEVSYWIGDFDRKYMGVRVYYRVSVNGEVQVSDSHFWSNYWNKTDDGLGAVDGRAVYGPLNSASFLATGLYRGQIDMADLQIAIARNHLGYEPPEWCPGPKPA